MIIKCSNPDCGVTLKFDETRLNPARPEVKCPKCQTLHRVALPHLAPPAAEARPVPPPPAAALPSEVGWLIVHDEHTPEQTFALRPGPNVIGRYSPTQSADISIHTADAYMSRRHCTIEVNLNRYGQLEYTISDIGSTNGTFINADVKSRLSPDDVLFLNDGDVIQIGRTKVVLKTLKVAADASHAQQQVRHLDFSKTIIL